MFASISSKLIRRHPHVFGDWVVGGSDDVLRNWDQIKRSERASSGESTSLLASVPKALPALSRAHAVQRRAARAGFDWARADGAFAKVTEELDELRAAETEDRRAAELGDLLLATVAVARRLDLDPEEALREATDRFVHRFDRLEGIVADRRLDLSALPDRICSRCGPRPRRAPTDLAAPFYTLLTTSKAALIDMPLGPP